MFLLYLAGWGFVSYSCINWILQKPEPETELCEDSLLGKQEIGQGDKKPESCVSRLCVVTSRV